MIFVERETTKTTTFNSTSEFPTTGEEKTDSETVRRSPLDKGKN